MRVRVRAGLEHESQRVRARVRVRVRFRHEVEYTLLWLSFSSCKEKLGGTHGKNPPQTDALMKSGTTRFNVS